MAPTQVQGTLMPLTLQEEEEVPSEALPIEPAMKHLRRGVQTRRSSYAFSHREGYASLITQGTILRRPVRELSGDKASESQNESEEDLPSFGKESSFNPRRISILTKKRLQRFGKGSQEEDQHNVSTQTVEKQATPYLDSHPSDIKKVPTNTRATLRSLQASSSDDLAFHSMRSQYSLVSQPEHLDVRSSYWRSPLWKGSVSPSQLEVPTNR